MALRDDILAQVASGPKEFYQINDAIPHAPYQVRTEIDAMEREGVLHVTRTGIHDRNNPAAVRVRIEVELT
jgi:hypothetical protein